MAKVKTVKYRVYFFFGGGTRFGQHDCDTYQEAKDWKEHNYSWTYDAWIERVEV